MKLNYHPETDSLYIDLSGRPSSESKEISEGVVLDYDLNGRLVGIDIDNASNKVELKKLILKQIAGHSGKHFPARLRTFLSDHFEDRSSSAWFNSVLFPS